MNAEIEAITLTKSSEEWIKSFNEAGVPAGYIYTIDEVFDDPQVKHLGMAAPIQHPQLGPIDLVAQPIKLSEVPFKIRTATPELGEHTDSLLEELGFSSVEIADLHEQSVV